MYSRRAEIRTADIAPYMKMRRQHHVWQHYLRAWSTNGDRIYCAQDGRVFASNTTNLAVQTDFYRLEHLSPADVNFIRNVAIKTAHQRSRAMHEQLLGILTAIGRLHAENANSQDTELLAMLDESVNNTVEQHHASIEARAQPLLDAARRADVSFYTDDAHAITFAQFLGMQYFRTAGMRARIIEQVRDPLGADIGRCWTILSLIWGTTVGGPLYVERKSRPLILLKNATATPFITGDQPIVNIASDIKAHLTLYYPIAPTLALLLEEPGTDLGYRPAIQEDQVHVLNSTIAVRRFRQLFANMAAPLARFV